MAVSVKTRFDVRLSREQKGLFEQAALLGGFRTLTEFVIHSSQQEAKRIFEENSRLLASRRDEEIFFNAITNPPQPNDSLKKAAKRYTDTFG